ncbi:MAG TPA: 1,6-anhydro-N-acetylmuramyl-L-alanine amidase AmpD [Marinagarivorans sp.]
MSSHSNPSPAGTMTDGWLDGVRHCPSPNYNQRPAGCEISLLVIHNISLPPEQFGGDFIEQFFCNTLDCSQHPYFETIKDLQVSAHGLITRDGEFIQFVNFNDRAWHAGRSSFEGRAECNDYSIGIELEGADHLPYTTEQYDTLLCVIKALQRHYPFITGERITGHSDIAPGRKTDPGPAFDWSFLRARLVIKQT